MTFGENLKTLRNSKSLSQKDLAEELGFSFQNISKWERNESLPDITTLLEIAKFFSTTTDALLGYVPEENLSTLKIDADEVKVFKTYPAQDENVTRNLVFAIDGDKRISAIVFVPHMRKFRHDGYIRENYNTYDDSSTIVYENQYWDSRKRQSFVEYKRIKVPENGFVFAVSDAAFASKKIVKFITPDEYAEYLNPETHAGYYDSRYGRLLFSDILKHNELDDITVEISDDGLHFSKPSETVDPMAVNIETLAKLVRRELQKEHDKQIEELKSKLDEVTDMVEDSESRIMDLEEKIAELESKLESKEE